MVELYLHSGIISLYCIPFLLQGAAFDFFDIMTPWHLLARLVHMKSTQDRIKTRNERINSTLIIFCFLVFY